MYISIEIVDTTNDLSLPGDWRPDYFEQFIFDLLRVIRCTDFDKESVIATLLLYVMYEDFCDANPAAVVQAIKGSNLKEKLTALGQ